VRKVEQQITTEAVKTGVTLATIMAHIRQNNISYLIGVYVAYSMGLLGTVQTHVAGICI